MNTWPNWVDLIVVTIVLRTCYNGFGRGFFSELLNLLGAISATALTVNYAGLATRYLQPWLWFNPTVAACLVFWMVFGILIVAIHMLLRRVTEVVKWEHVHWLTQTSGLVLGGLRGLWWSGFILLTLVSSGFVYLQESVEQRSVTGPYMLEWSNKYLPRLINEFPGARARGEIFIPPINPTTARVKPKPT